jgi:hypothetical protein
MAQTGEAPMSHVIDQQVADLSLGVSLPRKSLLEELRNGEINSRGIFFRIEKIEEVAER